MRDGRLRTGPALLWGTALFSLASPAWAHGIEGVVHTLAIIGASVGLASGLATAALRIKLAAALATTLAALLIAGMFFMLVGVRELSDPLTELGTMFLLLTLFAAVPLAIVFFAAFATFSLLRARLWVGKAKPGA